MSQERKIADTLTRVADLLARPNGWTTGVFCRNPGGESVERFDPTRSCFCVSGALREVTGTTDYLAWNAFDAYTVKKGYRHMAEWNDDPARTQDEVVAALRFVAKAYEKRANLK